MTGAASFLFLCAALVAALIGGAWPPAEAGTDGISIPPWVQRAKLTANGGVADDNFGDAVSISGDYAVVGAYPADTYKGAAYLFRRPAAGWGDMTHTQKLVAGDGMAGDWFGISVANDGNTVVVGAPGDEGSTGAVYVFEPWLFGWIQVAKLTASDGANLDKFGHSVAISGPYVAAGAPGDNPHGDGSGSAYVFVEPIGGWQDMTQRDKITASDGAADDAFGSSVAVDGSIVVVGAPGDEGDTGAAYVFGPGFGGQWWQRAKLTASDGQADDWFGYSVAIHGDVVAGARNAAGRNDDTGAAYVFELPNTGWMDMTHTAKLTASDGMASDWFGTSVAISEGTVVVGASGDDHFAGNRGSGYIFDRPGTGWADAIQSDKVVAIDGDEYDWFGTSVSLSGDTAIFGASGDEAKKGAAYIFWRTCRLYLPLVARGASSQ
jgi:hypothetical protein